MFEFAKFAFDEFEVGAVAALLLLIAGGDVGIAEEHEVVDVVAGLEEEATHGAVGDHILGEDDGSHVEHDEFFHVAFFLAQGEAEPFEDALHHVCATGLMAVEGPPLLGVVAFDAGFAHIVQQGGPAQI